MRARVRAGGRLHFGFMNLSLAHERLYGGIGTALADPATVVTADPGEAIECDDEDAAVYARRAADLLEVPGATVRVEESLPRHAGLGSGTQLALSVYAAVARAHGLTPDVRSAAPELDRGGRSGVGVAVFEGGGFVVDAGHPAKRFTMDRPARGEWAVPAVVARHAVPPEWRFVLAVPSIDAGRSDEREDASMRRAVERADPAIADEISGLVVRRLLPAIATGDRAGFGRAVTDLGRLNGAWYAEEQGGVYRPPIGAIVDDLTDSPAIDGAGQSSWGPAVYGVTDVDGAAAARETAREALDAAGVDGDVRVVAPRNEGASVGTS